MTLFALLAALPGCALTEESFPDAFADERVRIDFLDYARLRYEGDPNATCDGDLAGDTGAFAETEDVRWGAYRDALLPCEFDQDAAEACLAALRDIKSCDDALDAYRASSDNLLFAVCADACGVAASDANTEL